MSITSKVNSKIVIKTAPPKYFHCFKLSESSYALFDIKMDMPIVIGSLAIIKSTQLPKNSIVFYYKIESKGFFEKAPENTITINGEVPHQKPPLRYHYIEKGEFLYHVFKLSNVLYVLWDSNVKMPIIYGSNQKLQATLNQLPKTSTIYYYKEDATVKNSFKFYMMFESNDEK
jgi:hypothetical protein